jgi:23S rRNA (adenine2503-C2)-methyltransferase
MVVATSPVPNLYGLERPELAAALEPLGARRFHAHQAYRWMYARGEHDPARWTDHGKPLRTAIGEAFRVAPGSATAHARADDGTVKYRFATPSGDTVESVYMIAEDGRVTLCISSQVGCALMCDFCLTGTMGLTRHLTTGEIVGQVDGLRRAHELGDAPFNVVFMGMGEPLHNYGAVTAAVRLLTDPDGFGLSRKRITVSTVGLVPAIERLAGEPVRPRLAVSLNATTDAVRDRIMPVNRKWNLARLLAACRTYREVTGERFTFEYVLLDGVNASDEDVDRLTAIVREHRAKLNLIPFNAVPGHLAYAPPSTGRVQAIRDRMLSRGVPVSIRWSRGRDARAACGQLALLPEGAGP